MKNLNFIFLLLVGVLISSCGKDDVAKTPSELLKSGTWKLSSIKFAGIVISEPCNTDDTWVFGATTVAENVGALKCDLSEANSTSPYTLSADGKILTIDGEATVVTSLTESQLVLLENTLGATVTFVK